MIITVIFSSSPLLAMGEQIASGSSVKEGKNENIEKRKNDKNKDGNRISNEGEVFPSKNESSKDESAETSGTANGQYQYEQRNKKISKDSSVIRKKSKLNPQEDITWESEDFTYSNAEKPLHGCDYTRQFTIRGRVISGFSVQGEEKLKKSQDIVLPGYDTDGNVLVGVGNSAFNNKGIKSVKFPAGMMVRYKDTVTNKITKRGNFVIFDNAFANNKLKEVNLPVGVIACLTNSFMNNEIEKVKIPRTMWWLENQSFAKNKITKVDFPSTCDFQLELHGMTFARNKIRSVRLPDFTSVVFKVSFAFNPGMEPRKDTLPSSVEKMEQEDGFKYGIVYMYTDNPALSKKDRIHTIQQTTASRYSWCQKLVINDGSPDTQNADKATWNNRDFKYEDYALPDGRTGVAITGLSESGKQKRKVNKHMVIPEKSPDKNVVYALADTDNSHGLFATDTEKFESLQMSDKLLYVGKNALRDSGLKQVEFAPRLKKVGETSFMMNEISSVILPDTVTEIGRGAFATNTAIEEIGIPENDALKEIPESAFGCSDNKHYMPKLRNIDIPDNIVEIKSRAFAGNNFKKIIIPKSVKSIGQYAFSSKNYLKGSCILELPEGLETIGDYAFRNKSIKNVNLPSTVTGLPAHVFMKQYTEKDSNGNLHTVDGQATVVYVLKKSQFDNKTRFPNSKYHKLRLVDWNVWTADDFEYQDVDLTENDLYPLNDKTEYLNEKIHVVKGLSEDGLKKIEKNKYLTIPSEDPEGRKIQGVAENAFNGIGIRKLTLPSGIKTKNNGKWDSGIAYRGDFFVMKNAFSDNALSTLIIPEGIIYIGDSAFKGNNLSSAYLPSTLMRIGKEAFSGKIGEGGNRIRSISFKSKTDFPLNIDTLAFAANKLRTVQLPSNAGMVTPDSFAGNTGMEKLPSTTLTGTDFTAMEKSGGVVHMYKTGTPSENIAYQTSATNKSNSQKLISGQRDISEEPWEAEDFRYSIFRPTVITGLSDQGKKKIKVNTELVIPDENIAKDKITAIDDGNYELGTFGIRTNDNVYVPTEVMLPDSIEKIGDDAFIAYISDDGKQHGVKTVQLPSALKEIGDYAFANIPAEEINMPDSVIRLGEGAFAASRRSKVKIKNIKLSAKLNNIPDSAFENQAVKDVKIPRSVTNIGRNSFANNGVDKLILPEKLERIGSRAFDGHLLDTVVIPNDVKFIGRKAFKSGSVKGESIFENLELGSGVERIEDKAFANGALDYVEIPKKLTYLDPAAFDDNFVGGEPKKVSLRTGIHEQADGKGKYSGLTTDSGDISGHKIAYDKLAGTGWKYDSFTYSGDGTAVTGLTGSGKAERLKNHILVIPDKPAFDSTKRITSIGDSAFAFTAEEVTIGKYDASSPNGVQQVIFPLDLKEIGAKAFEYNDIRGELALKAVKNIKSIGESAFHGNHIKKIEIPNTVTNIGSGAFSMNEITDLSLPVNKEFTKISQGAFSMNIRMKKIDIPNTITEIGDMAFAGARLETLEIPNSVQKIGVKAFHLHHLTELKIPKNVKEIETSAFEGTFKATTLKKLTIENGVRKIGRYAFKEALLEQIRLPESITEIGEEPFLNNTGKDGSHVVEILTRNKAHLNFPKAKYHIIKFAADTERIAGSEKFETSYKVADTIKKAKKVSKFKTIVVSNGASLKENASLNYLAKKKGSAVIFTDKRHIKSAAVYIKRNVKKGGRVYLAGNKKSVPDSLRRHLKGYKFMRIQDRNAAAFNLKVLKIAKVANKSEILVCGNYSDAVISSSTGKPVLFVGKSLSGKQKKYLKKIKGEKYTIIKSNNAVNSKVTKQLRKYGKVKSYKNKDIYNTSLKIAGLYYKSSGGAILAYENFDRVSAASLAAIKRIPLIVVNKENTSDAAKYIKSKNIYGGGYVIGTTKALSDESVKSIMQTCKVGA